ncbi:G-type lectin S-receptor-like serine/threonine-protein kinase At4g27290 [Zingiber officinale]|uniref:G-type lectin S-receptor-like serine/threonine-protein kinase At4g27290 n=1 Tax=Zingiber officinale TaxID=94328 RepID=UPI001C4CBF93|nr:G-type lectin S-receptor-like serine/threonine-protein kinase At4g27290 [Zingiber officinale]
MVRRALLLLCLIAVCFAADNLTPDEPLLDASDATLISSGDKFELGFFSPDPTSPNRYVGIWFYNMTPQTVVWVANRRTPVVGRSGNLSVTSAGMLILSDGNSTIWSSSGSPALANPVARLLDTGNFVVGETGGSGSSTWQSFDLPTDTLLPGMQIGINLTSGRRANLTAWRTAVDPSPGDFVMGVDWRGVPQMVVWRGAQPYWRAGPSNGLYLSGAPQMYTENLVDYQYTIDGRDFLLGLEPDPDVGGREPGVERARLCAAGSLRLLRHLRPLRRLLPQHLAPVPVPAGIPPGERT